MRPMGLFLVLTLTASGCASDGSTRRTAANIVLGAVVVGSAALAIAAAGKSQSIQHDLQDQVDRNAISGRQFADKDAEGKRWNRVGRAATFVGGLGVIGLGISLEMGLQDRTAVRPERTPADDPKPIFPVPSAVAWPPAGSPTGLARDQRSATAR